MGGSRCSYRDCTMRNNNPDKPLHMYHFPVFDKARCHQWITNSQKLNFLNLKLSQLKNRVICEHHFKDSEFMNYTKSKLKHNAVPTEDGPYCQSKSQGQEENMLPIQIEDIENSDKLNKFEKRAHFPVKYGDFLLNDMPEPIVVPTSESPTRLIKEEPIPIFYHKLNSSNFYEKLPSENLPVREVSLERKKPKMITRTNKAIKDIEIKQDRQLPRMTRSTYNNNNKVKILSEKKISEPVTLKGELRTVSPSLVLTVPAANKRQVDGNARQVETHYINIEIPPITANVPLFDHKNVQIQPPVIEQSTRNEYPNSNQIFNIEEYNLSGQNESNLYVLQDMNPDIQMVNQESVNANLTADMVVPISSAPIDMPDISMPTMREVISHEVKPDVPVIATPIAAKSTVVDHPNIPAYPIKNKAQDSLLRDPQAPIVKDKQNVTPTKKTKVPISSMVSKVSPKSKLPSKKMAEIVEKRKYNMKLRDIITSCIDKLDDESVSKKINTNKNENNVGAYLNTNPNSQENIIGYLEARLQRMEDALLNKIDQNTQKIADLKKSFKQIQTKKSTFTQTYVSRDNKKQLYQQISKFLTPEANSLIYEELFINKYTEKLSGTESEPPKKRKK